MALAVVDSIQSHCIHQIVHIILVDTTINILPRSPGKEMVGGSQIKIEVSGNVRFIIWNFCIKF